MFLNEIFFWIGESFHFSPFLKLTFFVCGGFCGNCFGFAICLFVWNAGNNGFNDHRTSIGFGGIAIK